MAAKKSTPLTSYFFILLLISGGSLLVFSLFEGWQNEIFSGLRQIGLGITLIGAGEWVNHPLQKSITCAQKDDVVFEKFFHRQRNPSALGNLLEIIGLILTFTGLAEYI
ncbi:MAG: hypothetical protein V2I36_01485 [Desulfopila sp.]|nr:hypothetical protein [Desulfopila sp.]